MKLDHVVRGVLIRFHALVTALDTVVQIPLALLANPWSLGIKVLDMKFDQVVNGVLIRFHAEVTAELTVVHIPRARFAKL